MVVGIDHIGVLVEDLDAALRFYADVLGLEPGPIETREDPPIRRACLRLGETEIELIEAHDPSRTMMRHLPHCHPGIYHLGLRVDDVDASAERLRERGVPLVDGIREGGGMRIQYLHPDAAQGTMIELVTRKK